MNVNVKLVDFLHIADFDKYKIHLACNNGECEPLDLFRSDYEQWVSWNEYMGEKDDFNRDYILSLIHEYDKSDSYIFAGIFKVIARHPKENRYEIEEVCDYDDLKGNLRISFHRYQGLLGRSFRLESFEDQLIVSEILDDNVNYQKDNDSQNEVPNIFSFATSELSQDAMFAWLIQWADDTNMSYNSQLCNLGKEYVSLLTGILTNEIHTINVGRQWCNIDIWAEINRDTILVIEDKTGTSIHDDQLNRYRETIEKEYNGQRDKQFFAYVKTGNEPLAVESSIVNQGYKIINRQNLLSILGTYKGDNAIVIDYCKHLQNIEDATNNFSKIPVDKWRWYEWQGFYKMLEKNINVENWGYVANPAGGFQGLWWHFVENDEVSMYLQFEEAKLCIKIEYDGDDRSETRWKYYNKLIECAKNAKINVEKPARFGSGTYMTIGVVPTKEVFGTEIINVNTVVDRLKKLEQLVEECMK